MTLRQTHGMNDKNMWPPKFRIDEKKVLQLFTGDRFYSSSDAALREAILNAIDACGRRASNEENRYDPKIDVEFDRDAKQITVEDNGDGMDQEDVRNLFTQIGSSAADLARQVSDGYQQVGEFGIGVVSYFLVCEKYKLHTVGSSGEPIGIRLSRDMLDAETPAEDIPPQRQSRGTTLILPVSDTQVFNRLRDRFSHWVRDVDYLKARELPNDEVISQGGVTPNIQPVEPDDIPAWAEEIHLGPPTSFDRWEHLDGNGEVDLLYRGVFVESISPKNLWGLEGSIHVNPKDFESKLNREGFIGDKDEQKINRFLKRIHPSVLKKALECVKDIDFASRDNWDELKWINLWLAIPRSDPYKRAASSWDEEFRDLKAFELLLPNDESRPVSVADLAQSEAEKIFLAPPDLSHTDDLVRQAVRVLRAKDSPVVQSKKRQSSFLRNAKYIGSSSKDILSHFSTDVPTIEKISDNKEDIVRSDHETYIFSRSPNVIVVSLGANGSSLIKVGNEIWINMDCSRGKEVILEVCNRNEGYIGLWIASLKYTPNQTGKIASALRGNTEENPRLGIVKRQYLRGLVE